MTTGSVRLVSLVPCITRTLVDLGGARALVGVTRYCPHVRGAAVIGGIQDIDLEVIASTRPDAVIGDPEENGEEWLARLGRSFRVERVEVSSVADSLAFVDRAAALLGAPGAAAEWKERFGPHSRCRSKVGRVAVAVWKDPWRWVGAGTYCTALLAHFGLDNVVAARGYPALPAAEVAALGPDLLLFPSEPYAFRPQDLSDLSDDLDLCCPRMLSWDGTALFWYGTAMVASAYALGGLAVRARRAAKSK